MKEPRSGGQRGPVHAGLADDDRVRTGAKKDRKKWCGGRVGRPHDWEWLKVWAVYHLGEPKVDSIFHRWARGDVQVCKTCGKHGKERDHDGKD